VPGLSTSPGAESPQVEHRGPWKTQVDHLPDARNRARPAAPGGL